MVTTTAIANTTLTISQMQF